jgi:SMI1 / KNR4 family (SUKH-1)
LEEDAMQSIDDLLSRLHELAEEFSTDERPTFHQGASQDSISAFQAAAAQVPKDFTYFLTQCDSIIAMDVWNGYWIGGVGGLLQNMARRDFPSVVSDANNSVPVIPVATDGGGNAFLMSLSGDKVWKWNHGTGDTTLVAPGFSSFLARIAEDWEHFLSDDRTWPYLSG